MNKRAKFLCSFIGSAAIGIPVYIFLHELGHTLVALACGANITHFSIFTASMSAEGGTYTPFTSSLLHAGGMLFPYIIFLVLLFTFQKKKEGTLYTCTYSVMAMLCIYPLLAWVVVPLISMATSLTANDDVVKFLYASGLPPLLVTLLALLLLIAAGLVTYHKGVFHALRNLIKSLGTE